MSLAFDDHDHLSENIDTSLLAITEFNKDDFSSLFVAHEEPADIIKKFFVVYTKILM